MCGWMRVKEAHLHHKTFNDIVPGNQPVTELFLRKVRRKVKLLHVLKCNQCNVLDIKGEQHSGRTAITQ